MTKSIVPHLNTALTGPLREIESTIINKQNLIEQWFRRQWQLTPPPFYASVDLRNAGYKIAPVDTNLFPAGWNNLSPEMEAICVHAIQTATDRYKPDACTVLLIAEDHTRNQFYWKNVLRLTHYFSKAGFEVKVGSISSELHESMTLELDSGESIVRHPLERRGDTIYADNEAPCLIVLNNDMSSGLPDIIKNISQPIVPPPELGWANRLKSKHFAHYRDVANELAEIIDMDPWLLNPIFKRCGQIDFKEREGEDCLAINVAETLLEIKAKYKEHNIDEEPFVFVKADAGTYGMNIMVVKSPDEVRDLNRKQRNKMAKGKDGHIVSDVLVQEGVYTYETWGSENSVAEPVVYMINQFVVGGFYRVHTNKGIDENLNAPGAHFQPLPFAEDCVRAKPDSDPDCPPNRFYTYGVVARMALLAAARERAEVV
ncbi:MAG: glutamate--cysteine ligase [Arenicella sp.]